MKLTLSTFEVLLGNYCPFFFSHKIQFLVRSLLFSKKKLVCCCLHVLVFMTETPIRHQSPSFVGLYICFYLLNRKIISLRCWLYIHMQNHFSCKNHPYFAKQTRSSSPRLDFDLWGNLQELRGIHPWFSGINFTFRNQTIHFLLPKLEIFSWFLNNTKDKKCHFSSLDFHLLFLQKSSIESEALTNSLRATAAGKTSGSGAAGPLIAASASATSG